MNTVLPSGISRLTDKAIISATGADTVTFLQGQLTNDIKSLPTEKACLAGYCTPKGRLLATMLISKSSIEQETFFLEVPAELRAALQKRLQMFIMRAKVTLTDRSNDLAILGILGATSAQQLASWFPVLPVAPYDVVETKYGRLVRLSDADGTARYQWLGERTLIDQIWSQLTLTLPVLSEGFWSWTDIRAGIPQISQVTQEKFVPQMINYELIGGISFKKGCYPGQEIVARSQYLGKQKRRMFLAHIASIDVHAGMEVYASTELTDSELLPAAQLDNQLDGQLNRQFERQPCGMIVNSYPLGTNDSDGSDCLIEMKINYLNQKVELSNGAICQWLTMPYSLPDEQLPSDDNPTA